MSKHSSKNTTSPMTLAELWQNIPGGAIVLFIGMIFMLMIAIIKSGCSTEQINEDRSTTEVDGRDLYPSITQEEVDLVRAILKAQCDGMNCFVYIADPSKISPRLYDASKDRGRFLRLISWSGDHATQVRNGHIFDAVDTLHCQPEHRCGIAPVVASDGMYEIMIYDGPRGEHTNSIQPGIMFAMPQQYLDMPRGF